MEIVKFSEFSASELTRLWNEGFKGYAFDMTMSVDAFIKRIPENQLSMEASIAICGQGKPVGFVMNGFRTVDGRLTAWNGGTGIIPEYRGRGLGKQLIGAALDVCREKGAEVALLEALSENEPAIKLYAKMGYRWIGDLRFYEQKEGLKPDALASEGADAYQFRFGLPRDVQRFKLPVGDLPWQTHWENIAGGESVIATDANGELAGYALFRKTMDAGGEHQATILYQCRTVEDTGERAPELLKALLSRAYAPLDANITRRAVNLRVSEERLIRVLEEAGFKATVHQVHMKCELNQA